MKHYRNHKNQHHIYAYKAGNKTSDCQTDKSQKLLLQKAKNMQNKMRPRKMKGRGKNRKNGKAHKQEKINEIVNFKYL